MPTFQFEAMDSTGAEIKDVIVDLIGISVGLLAAKVVSQRINS